MSFNMIVGIVKIPAEYEVTATAMLSTITQPGTATPHRCASSADARQTIDTPVVTKAPANSG